MIPTASGLWVLVLSILLSVSTNNIQFGFILWWVGYRNTRIIQKDEDESEPVLGISYPSVLHHRISEETPVDEPDENVFVKETWFVIVMPEDGKRIGLVLEVVDDDDCLFMSLDFLMNDADVFFQFPLERAKRHLVAAAYDDSVILAKDMCVLLGLREGQLEDIGVMPISNKTHWIRIVQRTWRRLMRERSVRLLRRGGLAAQRQFELSGNYGDSGFSSRIGFKGMLSSLQSQKIQKLVDVCQNFVADIQEVGVA